MNLLQLASSRLVAGLPEIPEALFLLADSSHAWLICPFVVSVHSLLLCLLLWLSEKPWPLAPRSLLIRKVIHIMNARGDLPQPHPRRASTTLQLRTREGRCRSKQLM